MNIPFDFSNVTSSKIAQLLDARLVGEDVPLTGFSIDTRTLVRGQMYIALQGENFDGHTFIKQAYEKGASCALVTHFVEFDLPQVKVADTRISLQELAYIWRSNFFGPVIGLTGSNGKTTVKELIAHILQRCGPALVTQGNLNNDIGVPITLLRLQQHHKYAVVEMGANHPGEIKFLTSLSRPNVVLVTNAASAHLQGFGTIEGVAKAKGEIFQELDESGTAVINADDQYYSFWCDLALPRKTISFGLNPEADVTASWSGNINGSNIKIKTPNGRFTVNVSLPGEHNVSNILAACAACIAVGVKTSEIAKALGSIKSVPGRLQGLKGINGSTIINDTYNANPSSLFAALKVLADSAGKKIVVLGDMAELGQDDKELHKLAGRQIFERGVDSFLAVGPLSRYSVEEYMLLGGRDGHHCNTQADLIAALISRLEAQSVVLVKGSRSARMENVVDAVKLRSEA